MSLKRSLDIENEESIQIERVVISMLFSKKKKEVVKEKCCSEVSVAKDVSAHTKPATRDSSGVSVKVLGSGCAKCNKLEQAASQALEELKIHTTIEHITDFGQIASYGVMSTPALVVNETVVSSGTVLSVKQIVRIIQDILEK